MVMPGKMSRHLRRYLADMSNNGKSALLISGGSINREYIAGYLKDRKFSMTVAIDGGLAVADEMGIMPTHIVGDYDTVSDKILSKYLDEPGVQVVKLNPEKDFTDTQSAFNLVMENGCTDVFIIGGTGTRLDHTIVNIQTLQMFLGRCNAVIINENNRIRLIDKKTVIKKDEAFGKYVSFLPLTEKVSGLTLKGFKYPLDNYEFRLRETFSLGVSNELAEDEAYVDMKDGILIMIESCD